MESVSKSGKDYFLGTLILKQSATNTDKGIGDKRIVIDGQQRLTTLILFLKVLSMRSDKTDEFKRIARIRENNISIRHNFFDCKCFEEIVNQSYLAPVDYDSRLAKAYSYFLGHIDKDRYNLYEILDHIVFVGIDLDSDEDEQVIFDTINSLGVSLTTGELLKNYVFSQETIDRYESIWKPVFEADEDTINYWNSVTTLGRLQRLNLETFLFAYLHIKINDPALNFSTADKAKFRSSEDLFNQYKEYFRLSKVSKEQFVDDLADYAKLYRKYISPMYLDEEVPAEWGFERLNVIIFGLDTTTLIPYLLFVLKNQANPAEQRNISRVLESYIMRRLICKSSNENYSDLFSLNLISGQILTASALIDFLMKKDDDTSLAMPKDSALKDGIQKNELTNSRAKGVLYLLESKLRDDKHSTSLKSFNGYSLEHLLPKKWKLDSWPLDGTIEERNQVLKTLGNLAIIPIRLNSSISNKAWTVKKNGYGDKHGLLYYADGLETMKGPLKADAWNEDSISERADWIFSKAKDVWQFDAHVHDDIPISGDLFSGIGYSDELEKPEETATVQKKRVYDYTKYSLNGSQLLNKRDFAYAVVATYVKTHPDLTFADLKAAFPPALFGKRLDPKGVIASIDELLNSGRSEKELNVRYNYQKKDRILVSADGVKFYVSTQWGIENIVHFISIAEQQGWTVTSDSGIQHISTDANSSETPHHKSTATRMRIELAEGKIIERDHAIETLIDFINYVGVEKVAHLGLTVYRDYQLVSKESLGKKLSKSMGNGYYIFVNTSTATKRQQVLEIASRLHIEVSEVKMVLKSDHLPAD
jgi:uncharacterized protein with ParB-like and HNH nuclease domain